MKQIDHAHITLNQEALRSIFIFLFFFQFLFSSFFSNFYFPLAQRENEKNKYTHKERIV